MNPREVCFLIDREGAVLWSDASDSPVALPDSRVRWQRIWDLRGRLAEIAHTHPLGGPQFSSIDRDTMQAIDTALGRALIYSIVTPTTMRRLTPNHDGTCCEDTVANEPWWVPVLRATSGCTPPNDHMNTKET